MYTGGGWAVSEQWKKLAKRPKTRYFQGYFSSFEAGRRVLRKGTAFAQVRYEAALLTMDNNSTDRFAIIRRLVAAGTAGGDIQEIYQTAVGLVASFIGLTAASLVIWNDDHVVILNASHARDMSDRQRLDELERELFDKLRRDRQLASAYMSFDTSPPIHAFTLPLKYADKTYGAVIGLQEGERTIVSQETFLEVLTAVLTLIYAAGSQDRESVELSEALDKERKSAVIETAVTVNHEVNNPLTAILGNVQLLLLKREDIDDELRAKLKTIEESALKIKDVTQRLMRLSNARSVDYSDGTKMIDLSDGDNESES